MLQLKHTEIQLYFFFWYTPPFIKVPSSCYFHHVMKKMLANKVWKFGFFSRHGRDGTKIVTFTHVCHYNSINIIVIISHLFEWKRGHTFVYGWSIMRSLMLCSGKYLILLTNKSAVHSSFFVSCNQNRFFLASPGWSCKTS